MKWTELNLATLRYFVDAVDLDGLAPAAAKNHVTSPAVSQALRRLEEQLGFEILIHKKRAFALSVRGRQFYERARLAIAEFERAMEVQPKRELKIAASATLAEHLVLPVLRNRKLKAEPFSLNVGTSSRVRERVRDGEARIGLLIDDEATYGFETHVIHEGEFELRSASGRAAEKLFVTEDRPEVVRLMKALRELTLQTAPHTTRIESWTLAQRFAETLGGMCWVPDLIPRAKMKRVSPAPSYKYRVIAITKKNAATSAELEFLEALLSRD